MKDNSTDKGKDVKAKNKEYNKTRGKNFISRFLSNPEIIPKSDPEVLERSNEPDVFPVPDVDENEPDPVRSVKKMKNEESLEPPSKKSKKIITLLNSKQTKNANSVQVLPVKAAGAISHLQDTMNLPTMEGSSKNLISTLLNQRVKPTKEIETVKNVQPETERSPPSKNVISSILYHLDNKQPLLNEPTKSSGKIEEKFKRKDLNTEISSMRISSILAANIPEKPESKIPEVSQGELPVKNNISSLLYHRDILKKERNKMSEKTPVPQDSTPVSVQENTPVFFRSKFSGAPSLFQDNMPVPKINQILSGLENNVTSNNLISSLLNQRAAAFSNTVSPSIADISEKPLSSKKVISSLLFDRDLMKTAKQS